MHKASDVIETIQAAHNLTIEHSPTRWRLVNGAPEGEPLALLEVDEQGIHCAPAFAAARRLPDSGLERTDVARVVVGWAPEAAAWHLGLLLANAAVEDRRPRWCGLASWPQGLPDDHADEAQAAGHSLARALDRPLRLIPPPGEPAPGAADTQAIQSTAPIAAVQVSPAAKLLARQTPPFEFDEVAFIATPTGYAWRRRTGWLLMAVVRGVGMLVLAALFLLMGIGTQTSGLAAVNPSWLPWLGMAVAGLLAVLALRSFWNVLTVSDVIVDTRAAEVRRQSRLSGSVRWRLPFAASAYVVVTQVAARPQGRRGGAMRTVQDVWLHLSDGARFWPIAELERVTGYSHDWERTRTRQNTKGRRRLDSAGYDTPAHHAARVMADAIGCDLWLDVR